MKVHLVQMRQQEATVACELFSTYSNFGFYSQSMNPNNVPLLLRCFFYFQQFKNSMRAETFLSVPTSMKD